MKTEKSTIKKEIDVDIEKIRQFTLSELSRLAKGPLPFCYQIGTDIIVGNFKVQKVNDKCWRVVENNQQIFDFFSRKDAIYYCIAIHKKRYKVAKEIQSNDGLLGSLDFDAILYRYRYRIAQEKNDLWDVVLFSNRYSETMCRMEQVKQQLKKSINNIKV